MPLRLAEILKDSAPAIVSDWAEALKGLYGTGFAERSMTELERSCKECLDGYIDVFQTGSHRRLRQFIDRTARLRSSLGFKLTEVQKSLLLFRDVSRRALEGRFGEDHRAMLEARDDIDRCLDVTIFDVSEVYQEVANAKINSYVQKIELINEQLEDLSLRDPLTGAQNHRYFQEDLGNEIVRATRYATPVSLLMLDVDWFKRVNDEHGHPFGDEVLRELVQIIRENLREVDTVARYGGEEIALILPETPKEGAHKVAEKVRRQIENHVFLNGGGASAKVTVSIGVATCPTDHSEKGGLVEAADKALYQAKAQGRNQVVAYSPPE
ncbi:MAG: hypothetical protein COZ06_29890 [Armatimonadetes bacterium CG_4_10_14_3_um_filter_66_18]|nr:diguanylate cyclase [Armatimonadota bacterium]OIP07508.1 MAG: hypothetical protein AUJ96_07200 [Armatimonadetes bacterium CG2_30_66_41]PIU89377.1 MAG: hypothetical protein COS65_28810 [Armatimonadetes bacterium CG06_land_8_20_14_3_00_66_21]PIW12957.1 MAG: hypothetical protein COW34_12290 [Armatimonadetes bacterium CG17_big_fil_post_rev_8_21_14_2_50_66_6]PIX49830.1 MAG: hypothetical protein COZ57_02045 [Armatimonadetes bacterium CG_4_8_14_3_um_filter_66_20]PIY39205.1 MAG: hypothetical protei